MYRGYQEKSTIPFRKGDKVLIKKGTPIITTRPGKRDLVAKRTYEVLVNHTLCGRSMRVGTRIYDANDNLSDEHYCFEHKSDRYRAMEMFGTDKIKEIPLMCLVEKMHRKREDGSLHVGVYIDIDNPTVRWVGSGGYWYEADVNDAELVSMKGESQ